MGTFKMGWHKIKSDKGSHWRCLKFCNIYRKNPVSESPFNTRMILWISQKTERFQSSNNSLHKAEAPGIGSRPCRVPVGNQSNFLLTQVQTGPKINFSWEEIKLGSLKSNSKSLHVLVQQHHHRFTNKTMDVEQGPSRNTLGNYTSTRYTRKLITDKEMESLFQLPWFSSID